MCYVLQYYYFYCQYMLIDASCLIESLRFESSNGFVRPRHFAIAVCFYRLDTYRALVVPYHPVTVPALAVPARLPS